jgi:signal transduction histidine kinase
VGVGGGIPGDGSSGDHRDVSTQAIIDEVLAAFHQRLAALDSALLKEPGTTQQLYEQVRSILEDVLVPLRRGDEPPPQSMAPTGQDRLLSVEVGTSRARASVHPMESLQAAGELFDVALPIIVRRLGLGGTEILSVSQRLHQAITDRIALASVPYVEFLLTKLHASREEERHRISRELHDRVGHGMALALQHLDLHRYFRERDDTRAEREFHAGLSSLNEALRTVQHMSTELRRSVGKDGVKAAMESYLKDNLPGGVRAWLEVTGDAKAMSPPVCEELYLIMREACRNAVRHGRPSELRLTMDVTKSAVTATVSDNGRGFSVAAPENQAGGGLPSMTERAELLNGRLQVRSAIGQGTTVTIWVPLSGSGTP